MPDESRGLDYDRLVADLGRLREKGLTQVRRSGFATLDEAVRLCGLVSSSGAVTQSAVENLLKIAVSKIGGELGEAAEYTFGLAAGTRAWPAQQRRKKAAERVGVTTDHFRKTYEKLIFEQVAEEILAHVLTQPSGEARVRAAPETAMPAEEPIVMRTAAGPGLFVDRLAEAVSAMVVGTTNEDLAELLERALLLKRERLGESAFWDELCVVFLADDLLGLVRDDLTTRFPDPAEARRERRRRAGLGRRTVMSLLLRRGVPGRWSLHSHHGLMPFPGAVLRMKDGRAIIQVTASSSHRAGPDGLRFEFEDRPDHYFESIFQEVVENSREEHEVVLVGSPTGRATEFLCHGARFRRGVMIPQQNVDDWLPAVIVISWRRRGNTVEPLLEINTPKNSTRELGKASHLSGYINQRDHAARGQDGQDGQASHVVLQEVTAEAAVRRELRDELGIEELARAPRLTSTVPFYYPDKENLFFYLFEVEIPPETRFAPSVQIHAWTVEELLRIREHQVLNNVILALTDERLTRAQRDIATKIAALNLTLHGHASLAGRVLERPRKDEDRRTLIEELTALSADSAVSRYTAGHELYIDGLAGLQYRGFFTDILPVYADVGVRSAAGVLSAIHSDPATRQAVRELKSCYENEQMITALPIEV